MNPSPDGMRPGREISRRALRQAFVRALQAQDAAMFRGQLILDALDRGLHKMEQPTIYTAGYSRVVRLGDRVWEETFRNGAWRRTVRRIRSSR